jgi:ATP-binding cassette subfamily B protein
MIRKLKFIKQENASDCGVSCLLSIIRMYGGNSSVERLRELTMTNKNGTTAFNLVQALKNLGFDASGYKCDDIKKIDKLPCIAHVIIDNKYLHYVIIKSIDLKANKIIIIDPSIGVVKYNVEDFYKIWTRVVILFHQIRELEYIDDKKICYSLLKSLLKPHKKYLILIFVFSIIYILLSIINTFYFKFIIDNLNKSSNNLYFIFYFFLIVVILKTITDYIRNKWLIYINKNTDEKLMVNTYEHLVFLPYSYFNNRHTGDIISRFNDLNYIRELISHLSITFLVDLILILFAFFILLSINLYLFLLACLFMALYIFVVLLFNKPFDRFINASQEKEAVVTSYLVESINAINTIKDLKIENYVIKKIKDKYDSLIQNEYLFGKYYDLEKSLKDLIYLCGITTIIFIGSLFILNHTLTLSNLILFDALLIYFFEPLRNIFDLNTTIKKSFNALKRISELYTKDKEKQSGTLENIDGDIEI